MTTINASKSGGPVSTDPASPAPAVRQASPADVRKWLESGQCVLVDVREPDEHARERIAGATLIPLSRFNPSQAAALARPGQRVVFHCRSGRRSADACRLAASLSDAGTAVVDMTGGIEQWKKDGLPVQAGARGAGISVMRQVQLVIGLGVLAGSVLAWLVHPWFIGLAAFFGAGLIVAGATGTCALASVIGRMPWNRSGAGGASCASGSCG